MDAAAGYREPERTKLGEVLVALSTAIDLVRPRLVDHERRVAMLAHAIGCSLGLDPVELAELVMAALVHDIGGLTISSAKRDRLLDYGFEDHTHAASGAALVEAVPLLTHLAPIIREHHTSWLVSRNRPVSLASHIIHLADRIEVVINREISVLAQMTQIRQRIAPNHDGRFHPDVIQAFLRASQSEAFWLMLDLPDSLPRLRTAMAPGDRDLAEEDLLSLALIFAIVVDMKSPFTGTHSCGVAEVAGVMAELAGRPERLCRRLQVAGYLHDVGKVGVPVEILEKHGPLTADEMPQIRGHSFHTWRILSGVPGLADISTWASQHHEQPNGEGYPYGIGGADLCWESRLIAVADKFTALAENRPYRAAMPAMKAMEVMRDMAAKGMVDPGITSLLELNLGMIDQRRRLAQSRETRFEKAILEVLRQAELVRENHAEPIPAE
ncbi:MAG: HD domain-containing protein [Alphaproteobacteria bacterium]|nr:HD domain-containing protein [Alphaproteobacteria bacterium]